MKFPLTLTTILMLLATSLFAQDKSSDNYQLDDFRLKRIKGNQKNRSNQDKRFVNQRQDIATDQKSYNFPIPNLLVKSGYPLAFGYHDGMSPDFPFVAIGVELRFANSIASAAYELGFMSLSSGQSSFIAFPITFTAGFHFEALDDFFIIPRIGYGFMILDGTSNDVNYHQMNGTKGFFLIKTAFDLSYRLSENWFITVHNSFLIAQDFDNSIFTFLSYYYIPSLGIRYQF